MMKSKHPHVISLATLALALPAAADVIYSNLQEISIPNTYAGVYLDVNGSNGWNTDMFNPIAGWDINPFSGGSVVANSPAFQPVRGGTTSMSPILNLATGSSVGSSSVFSTFTWDNDGNPATPAVPGYGGSQTHLGTGIGQFTAGQEGYIGFQLNGTNYGWMRVVLGGATPVIKDWAYDTSGAFIATGNILQDGSTVTLDSAFGSFNLGSAITGSNSVVKTGANSVVITGTNSYGGTTAVSNGSLLVNGSLTGSGAVTVAAGAVLGGSGSIAGGVTIEGGILSPGASIESLATGALVFNGGTFYYEMDSSAAASVAADFQNVFGNLALSGTVALDLTDLAATPAAFTPDTSLSLIKYAGTWNGGFFTYAGNELGNNEVFTAGPNTWRINYGATVGGLNFASEYGEPGGRFINLTAVNLTAVPEPGSWIALGCLIGSGAFLRRRHR